MNNANPEPTLVYYRCVCGTDVSVAANEGGTCTECGRKISASAVRDDLCQTIQFLDSDGAVATQAAVDQHELLGAQLQHYKILSRLGAGGMGSVYLALDESLQRYVAIKVLHAQDCGGDVHALLQEARAQARVNHPHIVHIYYVSRDEERPFLAMEFVEGISLQDRMLQQPLPFAQVVDIARQIVSALHASAQLDIVHGDIKPANILLADDTHVKLSDFGLSRRLSAAAPAATDGHVSGTPSYMAPELTRGAANTIQSDQYALGIMLYQLTFHQLPFQQHSQTITELLEAHRTQPVPLPQPWPQDLPILWRDLLTRLLQKRAGERFPSHAELLTQLDRVRPVVRPTAGLFLRNFAWTTDLCILAAATGVGAQLLQQLPFLTGGVSKALANLAALWIPALFGWLQARTGTSIGKKLMQIRIVDQHGLRPSPARLFARSVFQWTPAWISPLTGFAVALGFTSKIAQAAVLVPVGLLLVVEIALVLWTRDRRALHDRLFGTRVTLDSHESHGR